MLFHEFRKKKFMKFFVIILNFSANVVLAVNIFRSNVGVSTRLNAHLYANQHKCCHSTCSKRRYCLLLFNFETIALAHQRSANVHC